MLTFSRGIVYAQIHQWRRILGPRCRARVVCLYQWEWRVETRWLRYLEFYEGWWCHHICQSLVWTALTEIACWPNNRRTAVLYPMQLATHLQKLSKAVGSLSSGILWQRLMLTVWAFWFMKCSMAIFPAAIRSARRPTSLLPCSRITSVFARPTRSCDSVLRILLSRGRNMAGSSRHLWFAWPTI